MDDRSFVASAVFVGPKQPLEIRSYPLPTAVPEQAVVLLETSGICGTDVHIIEGALPMPAPIILGHEMLASIHEIGPGSARDCLGEPLVPGDLVAVNVVEPCGHCLLCETGGSASCLHLGESLTYTRSCDEPPHLFGGFAEASVCPTRYLHRLPKELPADIAAVFLCAGPTVIRGMRYAGGVKVGERVVVQGAGPVGLFATLYARRMGAGKVAVIASGSNPLRLDLARAMGADLVLDIRQTCVEERRQAIANLFDGCGADLVIEGCGNPEAIPEGLPLLRPRGRYVWAGQYSDRGSVPLPTHLITFQALQIIGTAQFDSQDRADYFRFMLDVKEEWDAVRRVVTHRLPVARANEALDAAGSGAAVKVLLIRET